MKLILGTVGSSNTKYEDLSKIFDTSFFLIIGSIILFEIPTNLPNTSLCFSPPLKAAV